MKNKSKSASPSNHESMSSRGVSRHDMGKMESRHQAEHGEDYGHGDHNGMNPDHEQRAHMMHMHHMQTLWIYWLLIILGAWLIMSPLTFDYGKNTVVPSGGREVWLSLADRVAVMQWSDMLSGILLIFLGWRSLSPNRPIAIWLCCFIGIWISAAPLIFWAPNAVIYLNDTLVGALIIALSILIPGMPNMIMYMKMGSETPPGWTYNPSSWPQRWIMIVTGFLGWIVSRYLASYQLGYLDTMWDPFFGDSSIRVLNSAMSHSLPVSDAGLGSLAYTFEFLMGFMGSPSRWRTMPWMVAFFGILVIPLGLVHIFLVISQPIAVGAWCTFCLVAAGIMLPMIPLEVDEVVAMGQHMTKSIRRGERFWDVFWKGGKVKEMNKDERSPDLMTLSQHPWKVIRASLWGMSAPWTLAISALLGIWLVCAPDIFGVSISASVADLHHLVGALIVVVAIITMGEVVRIGRYLNVILGIAIALIPWFLFDSTTALNINAVISGSLVIMLSIPRGQVLDSYGTWDRFVR